MIEANPFAQVALDLEGRKLAPVPAAVGGKKPLVNWKRYQNSPPSVPTVKRWINKWPNANVGLITGAASGLTVVDIDDSKLTSKALARFGDTPVVVRTPRGGFHLYYRFQGEATMTRLNGDAIDIRGASGFIVVPPSHNDNGEYRFERGDFNVLNSLPAIRDNAGLVSVRRHFEASIGERNTQIFAKLREFASDAKPTACAQLILYGHELNSQLEDPLPDHEVLATATSVWNYHASGRLLVPGQQGTLVSPEDLELFKDAPDALLLWLKLRLAHRPGSKIAVAPAALAPTLGWTVHRTRTARDALIQKGRLMRLTRGGVGKCTPAQYVLVAV